MNQVVPFRFEASDVRVVDINGDAWFVARDVAAILGYKNVQDAVRRHCKHTKPVAGAGITHPHDLDPQTVLIGMSDVFRLAARSTLPSAERFEAWIFDEVLPSIYKTGSYSAKPEKLPTNFDAIRALVDAAEEHETRLKKVEGAIENFGAHEDYRSIKAHAAINGVKITTKQSGDLGKAATALSKRLGHVVGKQPDDSFGTVNTYHRDVLTTIFKETAE